MHLLFVCTGNTCRSPLAEVIARRQIAERQLPDVTVGSAGTSAWPDAPASDGALLVALEHGMDLGEHRARVLSPELVAGADVVVTDTWVSMGQEAEKAARIATFTPYRVTPELFDLSKPDSIFLHCLPAYREYEVDAAVIDGPRSVIWDEAENRLHAQKALLEFLLTH